MFFGLVIFNEAISLSELIFTTAAAWFILFGLPFHKKQTYFGLIESYYQNNGSALVDNVHPQSRRLRYGVIINDFFRAWTVEYWYVWPLVPIKRSYLPYSQRFNNLLKEIFGERIILCLGLCSGLQFVRFNNSVLFFLKLYEIVIGGRANRVVSIAYWHSEY